MPDDPLDVAQARGAQAHPLDGATHPVGGAPDRPADVDDVADAVLVLDEHEEPRQEVADEALGTEAERDAEHPGPGDQRREVDPELAQHDQDRDAPDDGVGEPTEDVGHRLRPLCATPCSSPRRCR